MRKIYKILIKTMLLLLALPVFIGNSSKGNGHVDLNPFSILQNEASRLKVDLNLNESPETQQEPGGHVHDLSAQLQGDNAVLFTCNATGCTLPGKSFIIEIIAADYDYTGTNYPDTCLTINGSDYLESLFGDYSIIYETYDSEAKQYVNPSEVSPVATGNYRVSLSFNAGTNGNFILKDIFLINHTHNFTVTEVEGSTSKLAAICTDSDDNHCSLPNKTMFIQLDARDHIWNDAQYPSRDNVVLIGAEAIKSITGSTTGVYEFYKSDDTQLQVLPSEVGEYYVTFTFGSSDVGGPWTLKDEFRIVNEHQHVFVVEAVSGTTNKANIYCSDTETCDLQGEVFEVSFTAKDATYTGEMYDVATNILMSSDSETWIKAVNYSDSIEYEFYEATDTSFSAKYINPPKEIGEYVCRIKVDAVYLTYAFKIYHEHDLVVVIDGNTATVTCNNAHLCCSLPSDGFVTTLTALDAAYTGEEYSLENVALTNIDYLKDINETDSISYYFSLQSNPTDSPSSTVAPTALGDYYIYVYVLPNKVIKAPFSITHTHNFIYTQNTPNTLTVSCTELGCPDFPSEFTFELTADDFVYTGEDYNINLVTFSDYAKATVIDNILQASRAIKFGSSEDGTDATTTKPYQKGTYYASISVGDYTLIDEFEIYHEHDFEVTVDATNSAKATLVCQNPGCDLENSKFTVEISASDYEYSGESYPTANISITNIEKLGSLVLNGGNPEYEFALQSDSIYSPMVPKDIGDYYVKTTFLGKTIYTTFSIVHTHSFTYQKSGETIIINCTNTVGCDFVSPTVLSLTANDAPFNGETYDYATYVTVANMSCLEVTGRVFSIEYASAETPDNKSLNAPTNKGSYICFLTLDCDPSITIKDTFNIFHEHDFVVTVDASKLNATITCKSPYCDINGGTGVIVAQLQCEDEFNYTETQLSLDNFVVTNADIAELANGGALVFEFAENTAGATFTTNAPTDMGDYVVRVKIKDKYLQKTFSIEHIHEYNIEILDESTMIITCTNELGCDYEPVAVVITAEDATSTGSPYNEDLHLNIENAIDAIEAADALDLEYETYYTTKDAPTVILDGVPSAIGHYYACFAVGTYVIKDEFEIYHNHNFQATVDATNAAKLDITCKNTPCDLGDFSFVLSGPATIEYDNSPIDTSVFSITNSDKIELVNGKAATIYFYNLGTKKTTTVAPTDLGTYEYQVVILNKTIKVQFEIVHTHEFVITKSGNKLLLECANGEYCSFGTKEITIFAEDKEYDEVAYDESFCIISNIIELETCEIPYTFTYSTYEDQSTTISAPTNKGHYVIYLTADGKTISADFNIVHTHDFEYLYNGNGEVTLHCRNEYGCDLTDNKHTVSIVANDALFTNEVYSEDNLEVIGAEELEDLIGYTYEITYEAIDPSTSAIPPKTPGTYKVCLTAGINVSLFDTFTIEDAHMHDSQLYLPWESNNSLPTEGYYYLTTDVTLPSQVSFTKKVNICLNGHTINIAGAFVYGEYEVTFEDCKTSGKIKPTSDGISFIASCSASTLRLQGITLTGFKTEEALITANVGVLYLKEVTITDNEALTLISVSNSSSVKIADTTITDNLCNNTPLDLGDNVVSISGAITIENNKKLLPSEETVDSNILFKSVNVTGQVTGKMVIDLPANNGPIEANANFYLYNSAAEPNTFFTLTSDAIDEGYVLHYNSSNIVCVDELPTLIVGGYYTSLYTDDAANSEYLFENKYHVYGWSKVADDPNSAITKAGSSFAITDFEYGETYYALFETKDTHHFVNTTHLVLNDENLSGNGYTYTYNAGSNSATLVLNSYYALVFDSFSTIEVLKEGLNLTIEVYNKNSINLDFNYINEQGEVIFAGLDLSKCGNVTIIGKGSTITGEDNALEIEFYHGLYNPEDKAFYIFNASMASFIYGPTTKIEGLSASAPLHIFGRNTCECDQLGAIYVTANDQEIKDMTFKDTCFDFTIFATEAYIFCPGEEVYENVVFNDCYAEISTNSIEGSTPVVYLSNLPIKLEGSEIKLQVNSENEITEAYFNTVSSVVGEGHNLLLYVDDDDTPVVNYSFNGDEYIGSEALRFTESLKFYNNIFTPDNFVYGNGNITEDFLNPTLEDYSEYFALASTMEYSRNLYLAWLDDEGDFVNKAGEKYQLSDFTGSQTYYLSVFNSDYDETYVPYTGWTYEDLRAYAKGEESMFTAYAPFYAFDLLYSTSAGKEYITFGPLDYTYDLLHPEFMDVKLTNAFIDVLNGGFIVSQQKRNTINLGDEESVSVIMSTIPDENGLVCGIAAYDEENTGYLDFEGDGQLNIVVTIPSNLLDEEGLEYIAVAFDFDSVNFTCNETATIEVTVDNPYGLVAVGGLYKSGEDSCYINFTTDFVNSINLIGSVVVLPSTFDIGYSTLFNVAIKENAYFEEHSSLDYALYIATTRLSEQTDDLDCSLVSPYGNFYLMVDCDETIDLDVYLGKILTYLPHTVSGILLNGEEISQDQCVRLYGQDYYGIFNSFNSAYQYELDFDDSNDCYVTIECAPTFDYRNGSSLSPFSDGDFVGYEEYTFEGWSEYPDDLESITEDYQVGTIYYAVFTKNDKVVHTITIECFEGEDVSFGEDIVYDSETNTLYLDNVEIKTYTGVGLDLPDGCKIEYVGTNNITVIIPTEEYITFEGTQDEILGHISQLDDYIFEKDAIAIYAGEMGSSIELVGDGVLNVIAKTNNTHNIIGDYVFIDAAGFTLSDVVISSKENKTAKLNVTLDSMAACYAGSEFVNNGAIINFDSKAECLLIGFRVYIQNSGSLVVNSEMVYSNDFQDLASTDPFFNLISQAAVFGFLYTANDDIKVTMKWSSAYGELLESLNTAPYYATQASFLYDPLFTNATGKDLYGLEFPTKVIDDVYSSTEDEAFVYANMDLYTASYVIPVTSGAEISFTTAPVVHADGNYLVIDNFAYSYDSTTGELKSTDSFGYTTVYALEQKVDGEFVRVIDFCKDSDFIYTFSDEITNGAKIGPFLSGTYRIAVSYSDGEQPFVEDAIKYSSEITITNPTIDTLTVNGNGNLIFYTDYFENREFEAYLKQVDELNNAIANANNDAERNTFKNQLNALITSAYGIGEAKFVQFNDGTIYQMSDNTVITGTMTGKILSNAYAVKATFKDFNATLRDNAFAIYKYPEIFNDSGLDANVYELNLTLVGDNVFTANERQDYTNNESFIIAHKISLHGANLLVDLKMEPLTNGIVADSLEIGATLVINGVENQRLVYVKDMLNVGTDGQSGETGHLKLNVLAATEKSGVAISGGLITVEGVISFGYNTNSSIEIIADKLCKFERYAIVASLLQVSTNEENNSHVKIVNTYHGINCESSIVADHTTFEVNVKERVLHSEGYVMFMYSNITLTGDFGVESQGLQISDSKVEINAFVGVHTSSVFASDSEINISFKSDAFIIDDEFGDTGSMSFMSTDLTLEGESGAIGGISAPGVSFMLNNGALTITGDLEYAMDVGNCSIQSSNPEVPTALDVSSDICADTFDAMGATVTVTDALGGIYVNGYVNLINSEVEIIYNNGTSQLTGIESISGDISITNSELTIEGYQEGIKNKNNMVNIMGSTINIDVSKAGITTKGMLMMYQESTLEINATDDVNRSYGIGAGNADIHGSEVNIYGFASGITTKGDIVFGDSIVDIDVLDVGITQDGSDLSITCMSSTIDVTALYAIDCAGYLSIFDSTIILTGDHDESDIHNDGEGIVCETLSANNSSFTIDGFDTGIDCFTAIDMSMVVSGSEITNCHTAILADEGMAFNGCEGFSIIGCEEEDSYGLVSYVGEVLFYSSSMEIENVETGIIATSLLLDETDLTVTAIKYGVSIQDRYSLAEQQIVKVDNGSYLEANADSDVINSTGINSINVNVNGSTIKASGETGINCTSLISINTSEITVISSKIGILASEGIAIEETDFKATTIGNLETAEAVRTLSFAMSQGKLDITAPYGLTANEIQLDSVTATLTCSKGDIVKLQLAQTNNTVATIAYSSVELKGSYSEFDVKELIVIESEVTSENTFNIKTNKFNVYLSNVTCDSITANEIKFMSGEINTKHLTAEKIYNDTIPGFVINNAVRTDNTLENVFKVKYDESDEFLLEGSIDATNGDNGDYLQLVTLTVYVPSDSDNLVNDDNIFTLDNTIYGNSWDDIVTLTEKYALDMNDEEVEGTFKLVYLEDQHAGDNKYYLVFTSNDEKLKDVFIYEGVITLEAKEIVIDWCEDDFTYNGQEQEITATYKDINGQDISLTVTIDPSEFLMPGPYIAEVSFANNETNYKLPDTVTKDYSMKKFTITIDWCEDNYTFNNQEQEITATYKDVNNQDVTLTVTVEGTFKDAGTYVATAMFANNENCYELPDEITKEFTIKPYVIYIDWCQDDFTYNEEEQVIKATYMTLTGQNVELLVTVDPVTFKEAGNYTATASFKTTDSNYALPENVTKSYTMRKRQVTISWSEDDYSYNGQVQVVTATYVNAKGNNIPLYITYNEEFKNAGNYIVTASFANNELSYELVGDTTKAYTIKKIDYDMSNITFNDVTTVEEDNITEIKITGTLPTGLDGKQLKVTYSGNPSASTRGIYTITATFVTDSVNYNVPESMTATLMIKWTRTDINNEGKVIVVCLEGVDPRYKVALKEITINKDLINKFKGYEAFSKNDEIVVGYEVLVLDENYHDVTLDQNLVFHILFDEQLVDAEYKLFIGNGNEYELADLLIDEGYVIIEANKGVKLVEVYSHYTLTWVMVGLGAFILIEVIWLAKILEKKKRLQLLKNAEQAN